MKKLSLVFVVLLLATMFTGCDSLFTGSYSSVKPHQESHEDGSLEVVEIASTAELQAALKEFVTDGRESGVVYVTGIAENNLVFAMEKAVQTIRKNDPIGAFAVESIGYEIGTNTGRTAIAVNISYSRSRAEILRIKTVKDMDAVMGQIADSLEDCDAGLVVQVENYEDLDLTQRIQDYVDSNPHICMEMPQVSVSAYPDTGAQRVIELTFTYQTSREVLRTMQNYVSPVFRAAGLNVSEEKEESIKFSRMYAFLMERNDCEISTSITPAYSLLRHGVGDSKAFATVYAAMCRTAELDCRVISGTRDGEPWTWNLICQDGVYYHVDLIRSNENGKLVLNYQKDMDGYVWDYSAYPESEPPAVIVPPPQDATDPTVENTEPTEEVIGEVQTEPLETETTQHQEQEEN